MRHFVTTAWVLALCLTLSGCGDRLLERSYSSVTPHSEAYWENEDADTLRAENYQDLVNALLLLLDEHSDDGVVRVYGDAPEKARLAEAACVEVQKETPIGAYLLDYITYDGTAESNYYELRAHFGYRRSAEEQNAIVNATSTEALPDLLRAAVDEGRTAVAIRVGYFGTDRAGVMALVSAVHDEFYPPEEETEPIEGETTDETADEDEIVEIAVSTDMPDGDETSGEEADPPDESPEPVYDISPWEVLFYPESQPGIVEVILGSGVE